MSACPGPVATEALFKDVSRRPPDVPTHVAQCIASDAPDFARWTIYQDRSCDVHGCLSSF